MLNRASPNKEGYLYDKVCDYCYKIIGSYTAKVFDFSTVAGLAFCCTRCKLLYKLKKEK